MTRTCTCSTTDTAGQILHRPGCPAAYTVGLVVPAPGTAPLPARSVTVVPTCPAHPGGIFDACAACLREANERTEKAEAERDAARRELAAVGAERDWMLMAAEGEPVSDFAESFPAVARVAALAAHHAALAAMLAQARAEGGRVERERVREAVNAACACGGSGPDACCDACRVWHNLGGERMDTAEGTPHRNL